MQRFKLTVEYDGGPFVGWQRQTNGPSVQEAIERAIKGFCDEEVTVHGAGRTDAGVHALAQVAHVDLARVATTETLREALNFHLRPAPVAVLSAETVAGDFHARFSATARHYRYRLLNRRAAPALARGQVWHIPQALDVDAMAQAAPRLVGRHDFTTFRAAECQADSPVKTLDRLKVFRSGEEILIEASARSFLHHQVRSMVGSLKLVGLGRWSAEDLARALEVCDRAACGPVAPPEGLFLVSVDYGALGRTAL